MPDINLRIVDILNKIIEQSPFKDKNGNRFIVLTTKFIRCFFISLFGPKRKVLGNSTELNKVLKAIVNSNAFAIYDDKDSDKFVDVCYPYGFCSNQNVYICARGDVQNFDVDSACENVEANSLYNDKEKYVLANLLTYNWRNSVFDVYDFMNSFDYDKIMEIQNSTEPVIIEDKPIIEKVEEVKYEVKKEENHLDKLLDSMYLIQSIDDCMKLAKIVDKGSKFLYDKGFDLNRILKFRVGKFVNDDCGYPIIAGDFDSSPFPEDIEKSSCEVN